MHAKEFRENRLWKRTLAVQSDGDAFAASRESLRQAFLHFRERAALLAADIVRDLPEFTVHDISHLDALWEMADLIMGPEVHITPAEAFVLGGAFLLHDIGMGLSAYPGGLQQLRQDKGWSDVVATILRRTLGRIPTVSELNSPPLDVEREAVAETLRNAHARHADRLALACWKNREGAEFYLIDRPELRDCYGAIVGRIAYSHWWSVADLREKFATTLGAPVGYPQTWTVDPLKLACILRSADASHLDARRAPAFLRAVRKPSGVADAHWKFQEKLHQPQIENQRLVYTTGSPFLLPDAPAWWLCLETLQMVDRELRHVDALLADTRRQRLEARAVAGIEDPVRLTQFIPTEGWTPVDARIRVSDVPSLVERLGGEQLYGRDPTIPLRELVQNACDAVRARRMIRDLPSDWGDILVRVGCDDSGNWLEVEDSGVGMSTQVLTGPLLDFGNSYWGSWLMRQELVGLASKGFQSTGKFGIGFFSVFMWGSRVRVTTRRFNEAEKSTQVLEFMTGPATQPMLRDATEEECLHDGGTRVRVWLKNPPCEPGGILHRSDGQPWTLKRLCAWLCPALDVNLSVEEVDGKRTRVITALDWMSISGKKLLERMIEPPSDRPRPFEKQDVVRCAPLLRPLRSASGELVGRACLFPGEYGSTLGVVTVGGLRAVGSDVLAGVIFGTPTTAARNSAFPVVDSGGLRDWANEQRQLMDAACESPDELAFVAASTYRCGADISQLPICRSAQGWMTLRDILPWAADLDEILFVDRTWLVNQLEMAGAELKLERNVLVVGDANRSLIYSKSAEEWWPPKEIVCDARNKPLDWNWWSLESVIVKTVAESWSIAPDDLFSGLVGREGDFLETVVGTLNGQAFRVAVSSVRRSDGGRSSKKR
ncbi:hypothetical protein WMF37_11725 [Sorangium sp. So ce291]|uniref:HD domain-containing protein n=1 Tax=unclassified Sorangium TaxID=2621164 RepID=UPI003F11EA2C